MTAYEMERRKRATELCAVHNAGCKETEIKSISTLWLIVVVAIAFFAGCLANMI